jgi:hypothetical protein
MRSSAYEKLTSSGHAFRWSGTLGIRYPFYDFSSCFLPSRLFNRIANRPLAKIAFSL